MSRAALTVMFSRAFWRNGAFSACLTVWALASLPGAAYATDVRVQTPLGDIVIELFDDATPVTVANFLAYTNAGDYNDTFFHRSVPGFVIQGGGFAFNDGNPQAVTKRAAIVNEFGISNTRGTIAMAKSPGNPDSATSEWFINLADNVDLDTQNSGFTVFGRVKDDGMAIADAIAALPVWNAGGAFDNLPLIDFSSGTILAEHIVFAEVFPGGDRDTDGDGIIDDEDDDDDGDGIPDVTEVAAGLDPLDADDAAGDVDGDGYDNLAEYLAGTDIADPNSNVGINAVLMIILGGEATEE